jgi:hypothetical protein
MHHERTTTAKNMGILKISPNLVKEVGPWHAWTVLSNQARPPIRVPGEHQVFRNTSLGSNYRNISSRTLVQKVIPGYLQRTVDNS